MYSLYIKYHESMFYESIKRKEYRSIFHIKIITLNALLLPKQNLPPYIWPSLFKNHNCSSSTFLLPLLPFCFQSIAASLKKSQLSRSSSTASASSMEVAHITESAEGGATTSGSNGQEMNTSGAGNESFNSFVSVSLSGIYRFVGT